MSVTIRDIMKLPCMRNAEIVAGKTGIDNVVTAVSVLEYSYYNDYQEKVFYEADYQGSDITITAYSCMADDPDKILSEIKMSKAIGEAGVIIYYFDLFIKKLDQRITDYADEAGYPIIIMPRDQFQLRYSEAICEIQELIIEDQHKNENFDIELMETFVSLPKVQQNINTILKLLSNYLHLTFIATDKDGSIIAFAGWPQILEREASDTLLRITKKEYEYPYELVKFDGITNETLNLLITGHSMIKVHTLEKIKDVIRLYLKMSVNETIEAFPSLQLLRAIIGDEPVKMRRLAKTQGIDAGKLTNMIIFREPHFVLSDNKIILSGIKDFLNKYCKDYVVDNYSGDVVVLLDDGLSSHWLSFLKELIEDFEKKGLEPVCAYARTLKDTSEVREAYLNVTADIEETRNLYRKADVLSYHEILYVKHLKEIIAQGEETVKKEMSALKYIRDAGRESEKELLDTISSFYFDSHMSILETANNLFVHVNTVKYRLNRISESIGCKVNEMPEMLELYKALALYRMMH